MRDFRGCRKGDFNYSSKVPYLEGMAPDINEHVRQYLDHYLCRKPKYAVMISGDWGSGKTHLVRDYFKGKGATLNVSANGVASTRDLIERLYLAAYPVLGDKTMRALGSITKSIAGAFRIKSDLKIEDLLELDKFSTLIIDDVERSKIPVDELFGFLNEFVEHDEKHLILIGNELEILENARYIRIKEKVIGFTLNIEPNYNSVLDKIAEAGSDYANFIFNKKTRLIEIFREGGLRNLRIIENSIEDSESVFIQSKKSDIPINHIEGIYFAFLLINYYFRKGEITQKDIEDRQPDSFARAFLQSRENYEPVGLDRFAAVHTTVDLQTSDVDNEFLIARICEGREAVDLLARTLGDIKGRSDPESNAEWRNLWYRLQQDDEVIRSSYVRMMKKFDAREYTDAGEILHVFGLLYEMKEIGLLEMTRHEIEAACKSYVDDQFEVGTLPVIRNDYLGGFHHGAAHGLGFTNGNEPGFRNLYSYLTQRSFDRRDQTILNEISEIIKSSPFELQKFRAIILQGEREDNVYNRPFLSSVDSGEFAAAILREKADTQFEILYSLRSRYNDSPYPDVASGEAAWLRKLIHALRKAPKSDISRHRLNQTIEMTVVEPSKIKSEPAPASA